MSTSIIDGVGLVAVVAAVVVVVEQLGVACAGNAGTVLANEGEVGKGGGVVLVASTPRSASTAVLVDGADSSCGTARTGIHPASRRSPDAEYRCLCRPVRLSVRWQSVAFGVAGVSRTAVVAIGYVCCIFLMLTVWFFWRGRGFCFVWFLLSSAIKGASVGY